MENQRTLIFTPEQVRTEVSLWYGRFLKSQSVEMIAELLRDGNVPNLQKTPDIEVFEIFIDLNVGRLLAGGDYDTIMVKTNIEINIWRRELDNGALPNQEGENDVIFCGKVM